LHIELGFTSPMSVSSSAWNVPGLGAGLHPDGSPPPAPLVVLATTDCTDDDCDELLAEPAPPAPAVLLVVPADVVDAAVVLGAESELLQATVATAPVTAIATVAHRTSNRARIGRAPSAGG